MISIRGLRIDQESRRVFINDREVLFTTKEFDILLFLATNPDHVFSKEQLFEGLWGWILLETFHLLRSILEKSEKKSR